MMKALAFFVLLSLVTVYSQETLTQALSSQSITICDWTQFNIALQKTGQNNTLANLTRSFTVLGACSNIKDYNRNDWPWVFNGTQLTTSDVQYNIVEEKINVSAIQNDDTYETITPAEHTFRINLYQTGSWINGKIRFCHSDCPAREYKANNGIIIPIEGVLRTPTTAEASTIAESIRTIKEPSISKLAPFADVLDSIVPDGGATFFAPYNSALDAYFPPYAYKYLLANPSTVAPLLKKHTFSGTYYTCCIDIKNTSQSMTSVDGQTSTFSREPFPNPLFKLDGSQIQPISGTPVLDLQREDGVIQTTQALRNPEKLAIPLPAITDYLNTTERDLWGELFRADFKIPSLGTNTLTKVLALFQKYPNVGKYTTFTLFAVSDSDFEGTTLDENTFRYHIIPNQKLTAQMLGTDKLWNTAVTSGPQWLRFNTYDNKATSQSGDLLYVINGWAKILQQDIQASNGIIHIIDKVLQPPCPANSNSTDCGFANVIDSSVLDELESLSDFTYFGELYNFDELESVTVFVPPATAFNTLTTYQRNYLKNNETAADMFIKDHVVNGTHLTAEAPMASSTGGVVKLTTLAGSAINFQYSTTAKKYTIGNLENTVLLGPFLRNNGVVYQISNFIVNPNAYIPQETTTPTPTPTTTFVPTPNEPPSNAGRMYVSFLLLSLLLLFCLFV